MSCHQFTLRVVSCTEKVSLSATFYSSLSEFINGQRVSVRKELQCLLPPLLCHLYVEMLKGREWKNAIDFLKKHASIVGVIEPPIDPPVPTKMNGTIDDPLVQPNPIVFESNDEADTMQRRFQQLITRLSTMRTISDLDHDVQVATFRSCKQEVKLSERTLSALQNYISHHSHVLILQILQIWFHIETVDDKVSDTEEEPSDDSMNGLNGYLVDMHDETDINKFTNLLASPKPTISPLTTTSKPDRPVFKMEADDEAGAVELRTKALSAVMERVGVHHHPAQVFCVQNSKDQLCCADTDPNLCHIACGMEDSTIVLWSTNRSIQPGRKPYSRSTAKVCSWALSHFDNYSNETDDDDGVSSDEETVKQRNLKAATKEHFISKRCHQNTYGDDGELILRGHSDAVTDVLFSQFNPLLMTVSRDLTMRAWRASNYSCAAVYRGHNYPLWCVAESSTGIYFATGSRDATARLWSTDREHPLQMYVGHNQDVTTIAFHPNGNYLATGAIDQSVRLWDVTSGKLLRVFTECRLPVYKVAFSPNGRYLAAAGAENRVRLFDLAGGAQLCELKDHAGPVSDVLWKADSLGVVTTTYNGVVRVYDVSSIETPETSVTDGASSHYPHAVLQNQFATNCKRILKVKLNGNDGLSCVGND